MLHDNITLRVLWCIQKGLRRQRAKRKSRDAKRERSFGGGSSKNRLEIQDKLRFKKQVPSEFPKDCGDKGNNLRSKREGVETHQMRNLNVPSVERVILVSAW